MNNRVDPQLKVIVLLLSALLVCPPAWLSARNEPSRVVAVGDIHGDLDSFVTILQRSEVIDSNHNWVGEDAILIQTGDFLDRGHESRQVMDFLLTLGKTACKKGGRVVVLLGNHEVMNMVGDLRYVPEEAYASFVDAKSEKRRRDSYRAYRKQAERLAKALKQTLPAWTPSAEKQWMRNHPPGFIEHRKAFSAKGKYGRWLRRLPAVAQIDDTLFLHGGLHPRLASLPVKAINNRIKKEIQAFDEYKSYMVDKGLILPFFTFEEMLSAARRRLSTAQSEALIDGSSPAEDTSEVRILNGFLDLSNWTFMHPDGPLWFRGFATWPEEEGTAHLSSLLKLHSAKHFVVGHTPQLKGVQMRFDGKVFLIDTGMLSSFYKGGHASALEIQNGKFTAVYTDRRRMLLEPNTSSRPHERSERTSEASDRSLIDHHVWWDPDGNPLPFNTAAEIRDFLREAKIIWTRPVGRGTTQPVKILLEKDGLRLHAIFRDVKIDKRKIKLATGPKFFFRDDAIFELAAYELSQLLGLNNIPPTVDRNINGKRGTLQAWIEGALTVDDLIRKKIHPPDRWRWSMQRQRIYFFDSLIYNEDRNRGNILADLNWKLWMIDHTRAFRRWKELPQLEKIKYVDRHLWNKLQGLDEKLIQDRLHGLLKPPEIKGLLFRRQQLLEHVGKMIAEKGEGSVLFTLR